MKPTRSRSNASLEREGERRGRAYLNTGETTLFYWLPACLLPKRAGTLGGWSAVPERDAHQKAHVGLCGERSAERRETANSRAVAAVTARRAGPVPSRTLCERCLRGSQEPLNGKQDPCRLRLGVRAARGDSEGERQCPSAEARGVCEREGS